MMRRLSELLKPNICIVVYCCYSDRFKTHLTKLHIVQLSVPALAPPMRLLLRCSWRILRRKTGRKGRAAEPRALRTWDRAHAPHARVLLPCAPLRYKSRMDSDHSGPYEGQRGSPSTSTIKKPQTCIRAA